MKATRKENKITNEAPNYSVTPIYTQSTLRPIQKHDRPTASLLLGPICSV